MVEECEEMWCQNLKREFNDRLTLRMRERRAICSPY